MAGRHRGYFFTSVDDETVAFLIAADDEERARDALEKAAKGDGAKSGSYEGHDYVDGPRVVDELRRSGTETELGQLVGFLEDPFAVTVNADKRGFRLQAMLPASLTVRVPVLSKGSDLLNRVPFDSWLAIGQLHLGKALERYIAVYEAGRPEKVGQVERLREAATGLDLQEDVLSWMGEATLFVRGTTLPRLGGALVVGTTKPAASRRFIAAIGRLARRDARDSVRPLELPGAGAGVTVGGPEVPKPIHLLQRKDKVVLAYGDAAAADALDPDDKLGDSEAFLDAKALLGGDHSPSLYLAIGPVLALADSLGAAEDSDWVDVKPYLEPLGALVAGAEEDGDKVRSTFGVTVK